MSVARIYSRALYGLKTVPVIVEVNLTCGLPGVNIVGLAETAVKESRDRVKSAILTSGYKFPQRKIVVNLAPADVPKQGGQFDLPIALGILSASEQLDSDLLTRIECVGELSLAGEVRPVRGCLPVALGVAGSGRVLLVPHGNVKEASLSGETPVACATTLPQVAAMLGSNRLSVESRVSVNQAGPLSGGGDMCDVKGHWQVKRALEIAAAGGHNLLLSGPPGTGKSMLASRLPGILPPLTDAEATETAAVASISQRGFKLADWRVRPFRTPHHTASGVALVGGGSPPRPGEISLAHNGVLFLDELTEYPRHVLDVLREPLETGHISISRANWQAEFPARFQLVAAMNPCPCGYDGDPDIGCRCTPEQIQRYQGRLSGPFLDRIDIHLAVPRISYQELRSRAVSGAEGDSSSAIRTRVEVCRETQMKRQGCINIQLGGKLLDQHCSLSDDDAKTLDQLSEQFSLSMRTHVRMLRVARTIADLSGAGNIDRQHLMEALSYRHRGGRG